MKTVRTRPKRSVIEDVAQRLEAIRSAAGLGIELDVEETYFEKRWDSLATEKEILASHRRLCDVGWAVVDALANLIGEATPRSSRGSSEPTGARDDALPRQGYVEILSSLPG